MTEEFVNPLLIETPQPTQEQTELSEKKKRKYLPGLTDEQVSQMFGDWLMGMPVRYMEKVYDAKYENMRRVCRHKLVSIFQKDPELKNLMIAKAEKDLDFKYIWNYL
jgi:hypothetical protein